MEEVSRAELEKLPDQWSAWLELITASRHLSQLEKVEDFIKSTQTSHPEMRGPWLAELELRSQQDRTDLLPDLIKSYFCKFCSKLVTYSDITKYLSSLDADTQKRVHSELHSQFPDTEISSLGDICRDIILVQLDRFCGNHENLSEEETEAVVAELMRKYLSVQHLVQDMVTTDLRPSDEYLVLASHLLWSVWRLTGREKYFQENLALVSWALTTSPANWQLKLLLTRLLTSVGAAGAAYSVHAELDIKHLMLDSLGWVLDHHLTLTGLGRLASQVQSQTVKLYTQVSKDTADHIITAYRTGTFYQIRDIYNLRQRILSSYNLLAVKTEGQLSLILQDNSSHAKTLDMISYLDPLEDKDAESWAKKRDNRDLETMVSWDPVHCRIEDMRERSLEAELVYGRARQLVVKCVQAAVLTSQDNSPDSSQLASFLSKLKSHWKICQEKSDYKPAVWLPQSPSYPDLEAYNNSNQIQTVIQTLEVVVALVKPEESEEAKDRMASVGDSLAKAVERLSENVSSQSGQLSYQRELLRDTVWAVETLGLMTAISGMILSVMRGGVSKAGKKNKKGKGLAQRYLDFEASYCKLIEQLDISRQKLQEAVNVRIFNNYVGGYMFFVSQVFEGNVSMISLTSSLEDMKLRYDESICKESKNIAVKMEESYKESFSQVRSK